MAIAILCWLRAARQKPAACLQIKANIMRAFLFITLTRFYTVWTFEKVVLVRTHATSMKYVNDEEKSWVLLCAGKAKHAERLGPLDLLAPPFASRQKVENKLS